MAKRTVFGTRHKVDKIITLYPMYRLARATSKETKAHTKAVNPYLKRPGDACEVDITNMSQDELQDIIDRIEQAEAERHQFHLSES